jgi:cytochrome c551/c552
MFVVALLFGISSWSPGQAAAAKLGDPFLPGDPMAGRVVFVEKSCHGCHAIWGVGGTLGPDLVAVAGGKTFPQIAGLMWSHTPGMIEMMQERGIPRPVFEPGEMVDLIAYLYYLSYFDDPGDAGLGQAAFEVKGCASCHDIGPEIQAGRVPLNRFANCFSPLALARDMWNTAPEMRKAMAGRELPQSRLEGGDLANILAYINTRGSPPLLERRELLRPGDPGLGARVFEARKCGTCHSLDGREGGGIPDLARSTRRFSANQVAGLMWNHAFEMLDAMEQAGVACEPFQENELTDLIAFLLFVPYQDFPGDGAKGKALFQSKGCNQCHGEEGIAWSQVAPGVNEEHLDSPVTILTAFWNHAPLMEKSMRSAEIPWPHFADDEMRDLLTWLVSGRRKGSEGSGGR